MEQATATHVDVDEYGLTRWTDGIAGSRVPPGPAATVSGTNTRVASGRHLVSEP